MDDELLLNDASHLGSSGDVRSDLPVATMRWAATAFAELTKLERSGSSPICREGVTAVGPRRAHGDLLSDIV